jgi:hypothetical protein
MRKSLIPDNDMSFHVPSDTGSHIGHFSVLDSDRLMCHGAPAHERNTGASALDTNSNQKRWNKNRPRQVL